MQIVTFDTASVEPSLRLEAWHENMGVLFDLSTEDGRTQDNSVHARIDVTSFGDTVFGVTQANSQLFQRDAKRIARENVDHILVQVFLSGGGRTQEGVDVQCGDMLVIDLDQPHKMLNTNFSNLTLVLPRDVHPVLSSLLATLHGQHLTSRDAMVQHMATHLKSLWDTLPGMSVGEAEVALGGGLGLLENWLSLGTVADSPQISVSTALGKVIKRYIEQHLAEDLSPNFLASNFRISRSLLYQVFENDGGVAKYIWSRRLRRAMRLLIQAPYRKMPIIAVAFECGFSSEAHFSRAFRKHFGLSPSQARKEAAVLNALPSNSKPSAKPYGTYLADFIRDL